MAPDQEGVLFFSRDRRYAIHGKIMMTVMALVCALFILSLLLRLYFRHSRLPRDSDGSSPMPDPETGFEGPNS
ncbi:hypothetical protein AAC387_Pa01g4186 [Persea americana]